MFNEIQEKVRNIHMQSDTAELSKDKRAIANRRRTDVDFNS